MSFQMALDEVLFRQLEHSNKHLSAISTQDKEAFVRESHLETPAARRPLLRFYFSSEPWVTLGYFSKQDEIKSARVCRRLTGGGRVVHGEDFIFSLIAHKNDDPSFGSVQESYLKIHDTVKDALKSVGVGAEFYDAKETLPKGGDCFVHPITSDLNVGGKKIAGGAQKRSSGMLLHHESIQIPSEVTVKDLFPALQKSFTRRFGVSFEAAPWDPEVLRQAKRLSADGYVPGRWNEKRTNQEA